MAVAKRKARVTAEVRRDVLRVSRRIKNLRAFGLSEDEIEIVLTGLRGMPVDTELTLADMSTVPKWLSGEPSGCVCGGCRVGFIN